jgi:hypothetical protein
MSIQAVQAQGMPGFTTVTTNPYAIKGIEVSADAANAVLAREKAFALALEKAFEQVVVNVEGDPARRATIAAPGAARLGQMVQDFSTTNEKLSTTQYSATYEIRFRPSAVQRYLASVTAAPVAATETSSVAPAAGAAQAPSVSIQPAAAPTTMSTATPRMLLPFYISGGDQAVLWSGHNPLRDQLSTKRDIATTLKLPLGDLGDVQIFDERAGLRFNPAQFVTLLHKYNLRDALVVVAVSDIAAARATAEIAPSKLTIMFYHASVDAPTPRFLESTVIALAPGEPSAALFARAANHVSTQAPVLLARLDQERPVKPQAPEPAVLATLPSTPVGAVTDVPTATANVSMSPPPTAPVVMADGMRLIPVMVSFRTLTEWQAVRARLAALPVIQSVRVARLRTQEAGIEIKTALDDMTLVNVLAAQGLMLVADDDANQTQGYRLSLAPQPFDDMNTGM